MTTAKDPQATEALSKHLDEFGIPHGDIAVPGEKALSGRYIISQWQRVAAGSTVAVLAYDKDGELYIAMGIQRNEYSLCAGYMESELPKDNRTNIPERSSRKDAKTKELVPADEDLNVTAQRETKEELNIVVDVNDLILLDHWSKRKHNERGIHTVNLGFAVILPNTIDQYDVKVTDSEFADDDLTKPRWVKIRDIKINEGVATVKERPIRDIHTEMLEKAVTAANNKQIAEVSKGALKDQDAVIAQYTVDKAAIIGKGNAEKLAKENFGKKSSSLGKEGREYQKDILKAAEVLTQAEEARIKKFEQLTPETRKRSFSL